MKDDNSSYLLKKLGELLKGTTKEEFVKFIDEHQDFFTITGDNLWRVYKLYNLEEKDGVWKLRNN